MIVPFDLTGRTALDAGAASGLSGGFARVLARAGARVALGARRTERTGSIAAELRAAGAGLLPKYALQPVVLYYLSDASRHVTGTVMTIGDGQSS